MRCVNIVDGEQSDLLHVVNAVIQPFVVPLFPPIPSCMSSSKDLNHIGLVKEHRQLCYNKASPFHVMMAVVG